MTSSQLIKIKIPVMLPGALRTLSTSSKRIFKYNTAKHCANTFQTTSGSYNHINRFDSLVCQTADHPYYLYGQAEHQEYSRENKYFRHLSHVGVYLTVLVLGTTAVSCDSEEEEHPHNSNDEHESENEINLECSSRHRFFKYSRSGLKHLSCSSLFCSSTGNRQECIPEEDFVYPCRHACIEKNDEAPIDLFQISDESQHDSDSQSGLVRKHAPTVHLDGKSDENNSAHKKKMKDAISRSTSIIRGKLLRSGACGASVAVMMDGDFVWCQGIGHCNVETGANCTQHSRYRIASISKPMTAVMALSLWEDGLLDLDAPISNYLDDWPKKTVDGKQVEITTRHLLTHSSGIRHYCLKKPKENSRKNMERDDGTRSSSKVDKNKRNIAAKNSSDDVSTSSEDARLDNFKKYVEARRTRLQPWLNQNKFIEEKERLKREKQREADLWEYYITKPYESVQEALDLFKDDDLFFKPGSAFLYSSHGYVLLSRVLEAASGSPFPKLARDFFHNAGLHQTDLDSPHAILTHRVPCYVRDENHDLLNAPYVDNSYKWAGGGFISSTVDLVRFGSALLYSLHATPHMIKEHNVKPGYLKSSTVQQMWSPYFYHNPAQAFTQDYMKGYGLGWCIRVPRMDHYDKALDQDSPKANQEQEENSYVAISKNWGHNADSALETPQQQSTCSPEQISDSAGKMCLETKSPSLDVCYSSAPENELEDGNWVEGDPVGGRTGRMACSQSKFAAYHTGAAIGGSSVLLIMPDIPGDWLVQKLVGTADDGETKHSSEMDGKITKNEKYRCVVAGQSPWNGCCLCNRKTDDEVEPTSRIREPLEIRGIVVAIISNHTGVNFTDEAFKIAAEFSAVSS
ncbi:uncharacterized protein LOC108675999 [Hyalella azteca]|uniref:Uncharacterized protein LOC108675999 n=1 Tax=Hyalella azteca TaxID=294128 RepID=A0A8B7P0I9_HYAAZ|nr:uncharacterized protein LOC108675999 [Hyalella azteca]